MKYSFYTFDKKGIFKEGFNIYKNDELIFKSKISTFLKYSRLYSLDGSLIYKIKVSTRKLKMHFAIYENDALICNINRRDIFKKGRLEVLSPIENFTIDKQSLSSFTVLKEGIEVAKLSRKVLKMKKHYRVAIGEGENEKFIIGCVLALDMILRHYGTI